MLHGMKWWGDLGARVLEDVLVFLAAVIGHVLSWPVIVLVIVLLLLRPIRRLIGRLKTAKVWGGEAEFVEDVLVAATTAAVADTPEPATPAAEPTQPQEERVGKQPEPTKKSTPTPSEPAENEALIRALTQWSARPEIVRTWRERVQLNRSPEEIINRTWRDMRMLLILLHLHFLGGVTDEILNRELLDRLAQIPQIPGSFLGAAGAMLNVRNQVMHHEIEATDSIALSYVTSFRQLEPIAERLLAVRPGPDTTGLQD